jgi:hypothetical protein
LIEEDDDVGENEERVDDRVGAAGVEVFERDEHGGRSLAAAPGEEQAWIWERG